MEAAGMAIGGTEVLRDGAGVAGTAAFEEELREDGVGESFGAGVGRGRVTAPEG